MGKKSLNTNEITENSDELTDILERYLNYY